MNTTQPTAWYKQFWPWLIIFFPASAVVAGTITVIIAMKNSDTLVKDDWYKDGLAINQELDKQATAKRLGITADIHVGTPPSSLNIELSNVDSSTLRKLDIALIHPTQPEKDGVYQGYITPTGHYVVQLPRQHTGYFHVRIGSTDSEWQLTGGIDFSSAGAAITLPAK